MNDPIRISEIFGPTIQGEGALIGQPTVFVRTGGCDYRCSWCDTLHAVESKYRDEWAAMSAEDIFAKVRELSGNTPLMISLSGGNPAIQPLGSLIKLGKAHDYRFALETQGSLVQDWFADLDVLTLSPKGPSSGMITNWEKLQACIDVAKGQPEIVLKIVVFDELDYEYARQVREKYPGLAFYLQPGNPFTASAPNQDQLMERMRWLTDKISTDRWFDVSVLPQLHVLMWGNQRGV
jgi:7-carboxy-7-deazaguanine synthase